MKKQVINTLCAAIPLLATSAIASPTYTTEAKLVERVQVEGKTPANPTDLAHFYFYNTTGWGAQGCPSAPHAYVSETDLGARDMLQLGLQAKLNGSKVRFQGTCDADGQYVRVTYMWLE